MDWGKVKPEKCAVCSKRRVLCQQCGRCNQCGHHPACNNKVWQEQKGRYRREAFAGKP